MNPWVGGLLGGIAGGAQGFKDAKLWDHQEKIRQEEQARRDEATQLARMIAGITTAEDVGPQVAGAMQASPLPEPGIAMPGGGTANLGPPPAQREARPSADDLTPRSAAQGPQGQPQPGGQVTPASFGGSLPADASSPAGLARAAATSPDIREVQDRYHTLGQVGDKTFLYDRQGLPSIQAQAEADAQKGLLDYQETLRINRELDPSVQRGNFNYAQAQGYGDRVGEEFQEGVDYSWVKDSVDDDIDRDANRARMAQANAALGRAEGAGGLNPQLAIQGEVAIANRREELLNQVQLQNWTRWINDADFRAEKTREVEEQLAREFHYTKGVTSAAGGQPGVAGAGDAAAGETSGSGQSVQVSPEHKADLDTAARLGTRPDELEELLPEIPKPVIDKYIEQNPHMFQPGG